MNFPDVNEVVNILAAELRDKYSDYPEINTEGSNASLVLNPPFVVPTRDEGESAKLYWDFWAKYGNDKFLNSIKKISQQLKRYFNDDDDDVANDVRSIIFAEAMKYNMMRWQSSDNDYHSRLLLATAKYNSNVLYDCITFTLNNDFRSYEKEMITKMITRNSQIRETILVFFEPTLRQQYKSARDYMNLSNREEDLSDTILYLLRYSEHQPAYANGDWVLEFLSTMFVQLIKVVQELFPSKYKIIHPIPTLIIYMTDKISTKTIVEAHYMNEIYLCNYEWTANIMLLPDLTLAKAIICTLYGTEKAIEKEHAMKFMMALSKRYEDSKNDHEIVEALNLCLNLYRKHSFHGVGKKFKDLMVWWTEHFKGLYESLSSQSRDRIFKHVIKQQLDGCVDDDTILNWLQNIIDSKSNTSEVRHCDNRFMTAENWKIYFDMIIEKKPLMDRFHDDYVNQSCKDLCLLNDNYGMERLSSYRELFEGDNSSHCEICLEKRQHFYVPPCCSHKTCDHCVREHIKSKVGEGGMVNWERSVPCPFCRTPWKRKKALDEDAKFIKNTVHDEMDSFFLALVYLHSPVHKLPYHPSIVSFFSDQGIHLLTQKEEVMKNMRYFPQAWKKTFCPIVKMTDLGDRDQISIFKTDMHIMLLTPRDGRLEPFYVQKASHHFAHKKITVGDLYEYLPKATVIDDPKKKFVVGLDAEKVFFYRPHLITIKCANRDVEKKIWYHKGSSTEHDMRHSVHEDLLPFCQFKLEHLQNDSDMIACVNNYKEVFKCEVFPIIVSSTPLEQRVWTVSDDPNGLIATEKKLSEDLDDDEIPRIGSVWEELEQEGGSKKRKRDEVLYLCENVSCYEKRLKVTLVPMLFLPPEQGRSNQFYVNILHNSEYNGTLYDRIEAYCKVTGRGLEMETENTKTYVVDKKKQRWTRRKEKEEFYCVKKHDRYSTHKHKLVDINPFKLYAMKGGQHVLSLIHHKLFCLFDNSGSSLLRVVCSLYEDTDHKRKKLSWDDGAPLFVDEPMGHEQRLHIKNNNGQVEMGYQPFDETTWQNRCVINPDYVPVTEDLANSIL